MKNHLAFFTLLLFLTASQQSFSQCSPASSQIMLDGNNVSAMLNGGGSLWWNGSDARYEVPSGSGKHTLFAGHLWMGGTDPVGNLKGSFGTYGLSQNETDYFPGPLNPDGTTNAANCSNWDIFFVATSAAVQAHKEDYLDNAQIDDTPSNEVLGWPAIGNPHFEDIHGFALLFDQDARYAPFVDIDLNGLYEPMEGDFPLIKGDNNQFYIFNDAGGMHTETNGDPLQMEIHVMAYSFASNNDLLNSTTFYDYTLIHRGQENIQDFHCGLWVDPDIGCFSDDYIGSIPIENTFYAYNGDDMDENCSGLIGYGEELPIQSFKLLSSRMLNLPDNEVSNFNYYLSPVSSTNPGATDPNALPEYYNVLRGAWRDGTPLTVGGTGYDPGSLQISPFAFDGSPVGNTSWKECELGNIPGDRRMLMGFGPKTVLPTEVLRFSFASIFQPQVSAGCPDEDVLIENGNTIATVIDKIIESEEELSAKPIALFENEQGLNGSFTFTDASLNNPTSWSWDFGNGQSSTEQNPSITLTGTTANVCLTATNDIGEDTWCTAINILSAPTAAFSFEIIEDLPTNTPVEFTDLSVDDPTAWLWDFADGNTSTEQNPTHIYTQEGSYNVCLTVSNDLGQNTSCEDVQILYGSVDDLNAEYGIDIFPNPFVDRVNITIDNSSLRDLSFQVYDALGKQVINKNTNSSTPYVLELNDLAAGIYLLRIEAAGELVGGGKLIKE